MGTGSALWEPARDQIGGARGAGGTPVRVVGSAPAQAPLSVFTRVALLSHFRHLLLGVGRARLRYGQDPKVGRQAVRGLRDCWAGLRMREVKIRLREPPGNPEVRRAYLRHEHARHPPEKEHCDDGPRRNQHGRQRGFARGARPSTGAGVAGAGLLLTGTGRRGARALLVRRRRRGRRQAGEELPAADARAGGRALLRRHQRRSARTLSKARRGCPLDLRVRVIDHKGVRAGRRRRLRHLAVQRRRRLLRRVLRGDGRHRPTCAGSSSPTPKAGRSSRRSIPGTTPVAPPTSTSRSTSAASGRRRPTAAATSATPARCSSTKR